MKKATNGSGQFNPVHKEEIEYFVNVKALLEKKL